MKKKVFSKFRNYIPYLLLILLVLIVFHAWFLPGILSAFDLPIRFTPMMHNRFIFPFAWYFDQGNGLGGPAASFLWVYISSAIPISILGGVLGLSWALIERIGFLFPYLIIAIGSSILLGKTLFPKNKFFLLSPLVFLFNTYALMMIGGGQVLVALAYALSPLVLLLFIKVIKNASLTLSILAGLLFSLQFLIDIRLSYITVCAAFLYWVMQSVVDRTIKKSASSFVMGFVIPGIITFLLHAFWLLPVIASHSNPAAELGAAYNSADAVRYLSFAKFEEAISLLHPNWPENIFGKTYFMRPEFLLFPLLAYLSLFFFSAIKKSQEKVQLLFFTLLGISGSFLAKGANEPFGSLYLWAFIHVPGFIMFRDPTKWFLLVALSYSVLIPFAVYAVYCFLRSKSMSLKKLTFFSMQNVFLVIFLSLFLFLIRPALFGQLGGLFRQTNVPPEYQTFAKFLADQPQFSRTLWVPTTQRFSFFSATHPEIAAADFFRVTSVSGVLSAVEQPKAKVLLQRASIAYVIVPDDTEGEIFLRDRRYDAVLYRGAVSRLQKLPWLKRINGFGSIAVFSVQGTKNHFWSHDTHTRISSINNNPTQYSVWIRGAKKGELLVFSESYSPAWKAQLSGTKNVIRSEQYEGQFNSFTLLKNGDYTLLVSYEAQSQVDIGLGISILSLVIVITLLCAFLWQRKSSR